MKLAKFQNRGSFVYTNHFRYFSKDNDHILYGCEILWYCGVRVSLSFDLNYRIFKYHVLQFKIHGLHWFTFFPFPHAIFVKTWTDYS